MRVVAGALGGRRLVAPRGLATRPTSDRVREALFSSLGDVSGAHVLDLFAGTGALGIEALSRGAAHATFVENARAALDALRQNLHALALDDRAKVLAQPVARAVPSLAGPFDLAFVDPPYALVASLAPLLEALGGAFVPGARLVLEHASREASPRLSGFEVSAPRIYGDTALTLHRKVQ